MTDFLRNLWPSLARTRRQVAVVAAVTLAAACGGGGDTATPAATQVTIGGSVSGLEGTGLVLQLNGTADLQVAAGASSFVFPGTVDAGFQYLVSVKAQPSNPTQSCEVTARSGTASANISSVGITCTTSRFAVGGTISGLTGNGLTLLLNGGSPLTVSAGTAGFSFPAVASGTSYTITVGTQPALRAADAVMAAPQTCTIANGSGTVGASNVANVAVTCVTVGYTLGGTITGLAGSGLVLQNNGGNDLTVAAAATSFAFAGTITAGSAYNVTVKTQPTNPAQTCTVANAAGTANANVLVAVSCVSNALTIGGTVSGLAGTGLSLLLNGGSPLVIAPGATAFVFPGTVAPGLAYTVGVTSHPTGPAQTCVGANTSGTVGASNVSNVAITCTTNAANTWTVGGTISGLTTSGLVLLLNGTTQLPLASGATTFAFPALPNGSSYAITVGTQPGNITCTVANGTGTVASANLTSVTVTCQPAGRTIGGTITGYTGSGLRLLLNGGASLTVASGATTFTFATTLQGGAAYAVTVAAQPATPTQTCTVTNGSGTVPSANVTNVAITCVNTFSVGGPITNQNGNGLVLLLNGGSPLARNADAGSFSFTGLASGTPYVVTIGTQPSGPAQTCSVTNGNGTVGSANVTDVSVLCINNGPVIGGSIQGYSGNGLTLRVNDKPPFTPQSRTRWTFPDLYLPGTQFTVSIASQPTGPAQSCTLIRGAGAILQPPQPNNVQNLVVACSASPTTPLSGTYTMVVNGRRQFLTLWPDGTYAYASRLDDASCGNTNGNGVEYGVYTWNQATGAFAFVTGAVDVNGSCGMWDGAASTPVGLSGTLVKSGGTLTLTTSSRTMVLTAVTSTPSTIVGSFQATAEPDGGFIVFLPDNTYLSVQVQANGPAGAGILSGYERGCYSSTGSAITLSLSASCLPEGFPALDRDGTAGASNGSLGIPLSIAITGPNTITVGGDTFLVRIVPN